MLEKLIKIYNNKIVLNVEQFNYDKYLNKGLSYCVVCDANFYKNKIAAIIGNDKSIEDVVYLSNIAQKVIFINKGSNYCNKDNVVTITNVKDYKLFGEDRVEELLVEGKVYKVDGVFYVEDTNNFNGFINKSYNFLINLRNLPFIRRIHI